MNNNPVRLEKPTPKMSIGEKVLAFLDDHAMLIVFICIIILFVLVGMLFAVLFASVDANNTTDIPSMVESGNYYYHLKDVA